MEHKSFVSESEIQQKSYAGISPNELMRWIIVILLVLLIGLILFGAYEARADDGRARNASRVETTFVHAVEMNCRDADNRCALYLAKRMGQRAFLRLLLTNGDDNPTLLRRGIIYRTARKLDCTEAFKCDITALRTDGLDATVTISLSGSMLQESIWLFVPLLNDE